MALLYKMKGKYIKFQLFKLAGCLNPRWIGICPNNGLILYKVPIIITMLRPAHLRGGGFIIQLFLLLFLYETYSIDLVRVIGSPVFGHMARHSSQYGQLVLVSGLSTAFRKGQISLHCTLPGKVWGLIFDLWKLKSQCMISLLSYDNFP